MKFLWCNPKLVLEPALRKVWRNEKTAFEQILQLQGKIYRHEQGRKTLRFVIDGNGYFAKLHQGVGWTEIIKNLVQGRWPVLGAQTEWRAIQRLQQLGVATMKPAGYGSRGCNPANLQSFVITEELTHTISLEDYCRDWPSHPPSTKLKRKLIARVAKMAQILHTHGVNHRDFYICHFLLQTVDNASTNQEPRLYLIDLHRVQIRKRIPERWLVKDIAGLYFSSMDIGLTKRDLLWFIKSYTQKSLRQALAENKKNWQQAIRRAEKLYAKESRRRMNASQ